MRATQDHLYTHTWRWDKFPRKTLDPKDKSQSRKGQRCRVVLASKGPGPRNALVEFEDGAPALA